MEPGRSLQHQCISHPNRVCGRQYRVRSPHSELTARGAPKAADEPSPETGADDDIQPWQPSSDTRFCGLMKYTLFFSCVITSLFRLYYAVQFTKTPQTPRSLFEAPFIYNSLWANIEPPVFIITGCFLTFGPLYRANGGPRGLFRSLRSRLLKLSAEASSSGSPAPRGVSARGNMKQGWEALHEVPKEGGATVRARWELTDVSSKDDGDAPRKSVVTVV
ncbi:MAG: hypothetical protein Q9195_004185 [Heterodermia aff. obscurata]